MNWFLAEKGGGVAINFGLMLLPLSLAVGGAVDYSNALAVRSVLLSAADAAALQAVSKASLARTKTASEASALDVFNMRAASAKTQKKADGRVSVSENADGRKAEVSFSARVPTAFLSLVGMSSILIAGEATARAAPVIYQNLYLVLDNSPSQGLEATTTDVAKLEAGTSRKCAFACHDLSGTVDYYTIAKRLGVSMRIDVVRQATQELLDSAGGKAIVPGQYRAAVYTFGKSCDSDGLTRVSALTSDLAAAKTAAQAVDLMSIPFEGYRHHACSRYDKIFTDLAKEVPQSGDGFSQSQAQNVVMFVSDGVSNTTRIIGCSQSLTPFSCQEPIDTKLCQSLKDKGTKVAVLYTTYMPLPQDSWYNYWIKPFASRIPTSMESCASPGLYQEVGLGYGIAEAMKMLFERSLSHARLTN